MLIYTAVILVLTTIVNTSNSCCVKKERMASFLEAAIDLISKAKSIDVPCAEKNDISNRVLDCADLYKRGYNKSGVYEIWPINRLTSTKRLNVYCDMITDGGGWTVIQKRGNFERENNYFDKDWENYKKGFGNLEKDFWLGNDNIFAVTNQRLYSVRFDLEDKQQHTRFARYDNFWIDDEFNNYTLHISGYTGTAGDAMVYHNKMKFGTKDHYNYLDSQNCALTYNSGWWFNTCYRANLNGMYNNNTHGINWNTWKSMEHLPKAEIKIRPFIF